MDFFVSQASALVWPRCELMSCSHILWSSGALSAQGGIGGTRDSYLVFHFTFAAQICGQGLEGTVASSTLCS